MIEAIIALFALGFVAAAVLAIASKVLYVEEDPRIEVVNDALPGANCGGCGFAGCEAYAIAVINDADLSPGLCCAAGPDVAVKVAELTGKVMGDADPEVAFRRCVKDQGEVQQKYNYMGVPTCAAAALIADGPDACKYSCLGFGDCMRACPFDAMWLEDGLVRISHEKCTSCGTCIRTCPNDILELIPRRARIMIFCSTKDKAKAVKEVCKTGCINCGACIKVCPAKCISTVDGRIHIDHKACLEYGPSCEEKCVSKCPRDIIRCLAPDAISEAPYKEPLHYPEETHVPDLNA